MGEKVDFPITLPARKDEGLSTEPPQAGSTEPLLTGSDPVELDGGGESLIEKVTRPPGFSLNSLLLGVIAWMALVLLGFVSVSLPNPLSFAELNEATLTPVRYEWMDYGFQVGFALFVGAFFGPVLGLGLVAVFLGLGLIGVPLFASGGGLEYIHQPGFGYLLGLLPGVWLAGRLFPPACRPGHFLIRRSFKLFVTAALAVLAVHVCGTLGLGGLWLGGHLEWAEAWRWWVHLSVEPLPYDILGTVMLLSVVRHLRLCLWPVLY